MFLTSKRGELPLNLDISDSSLHLDSQKEETLLPGEGANFRTKKLTFFEQSQRGLFLKENGSNEGKSGSVDDVYHQFPDNDPQANTQSFSQRFLHYKHMGSNSGTQQNLDKQPEPEDYILVNSEMLPEAVCTPTTAMQSISSKLHSIFKTGKPEDFTDSPTPLKTPLIHHSAESHDSQITPLSSTFSSFFRRSKDFISQPTPEPDVYYEMEDRPSHTNSKGDAPHATLYDVAAIVSDRGSSGLFRSNSIPGIWANRFRSSEYNNETPEEVYVRMEDSPENEAVKRPPEIISKIKKAFTDLGKRDQEKIKKKGAYFARLDGRRFVASQPGSGSRNCPVPRDGESWENGSEVKLPNKGGAWLLRAELAQLSRQKREVVDLLTIEMIQRDQAQMAHEQLVLAYSTLLEEEIALQEELSFQEKKNN